MDCTKRYEARGMMEWHPLLRAGKTRIRIPFTGGHLSGFGVTPASFETRDPVIQTVIERSPFFKNGMIRLTATRRSGSSAPASVPTQPEAHPERQMRFESLDDASDWLQMKAGIPSSRLLTEEMCRREASMLGISLEIVMATSQEKGGKT